MHFYLVCMQFYHCTIMLGFFTDGSRICMCVMYICCLVYVYVYTVYFIIDLCDNAKSFITIIQPIITIIAITTCIW